MRLPRRRVLLAALPLVLVTGVALAAQPGGPKVSSAVIHACVKKNTGLVRIVAASAKCRRGESSVAWNAQGARGAAGAAGAAGPQGPAGPAVRICHEDADVRPVRLASFGDAPLDGPGDQGRPHVQPGVDAEHLHAGDALGQREQLARQRAAADDDQADLGGQARDVRRGSGHVARR